MLRAQMLFSLLIVLLVARSSLALSSEEDSFSERLLYGGRWVFGTEQEQCGYAVCPQTSLHWPLPRHSGWLESYTVAEYYPPPGLHLFSLEQSFSVIAKHVALPVRVAFLGDSLSSQKWYAAECMTEMLNLPGRYEHFHTRWFVENPCGCYPQNNTDSHYTSMDYPRCKAFELPSAWTMDPDTHIVIANLGAWFNKHWLGCMSEMQIEAAYVEVLDKMRPLLRSWINAGIVVVWMGLPYSHSDREELMYDNFDARNAVARARLARLKVLVVDAFDLMRDRIAADPSVKCDDLHLCGFGPSSLPVFEFRLAMHFAAHEFAKRVAVTSQASTS